MKKYIIIPLLSTMVLFCGFVYGQNSSTKGEQAMDPKLSLKEQLSLLKAGEDNPVIVLEIEEDERNDMEIVATEEDFGPSNDSAEAISDDDRTSVDSQKKPVSTANNSVVNSQPEGTMPENLKSYQSNKGDNTQPQAEKSENVVRYGKGSGSNKQPEGEKPKK